MHFTRLRNSPRRVVFAAVAGRAFLVGLCLLSCCVPRGAARRPAKVDVAIRSVGVGIALSLDDAKVAEPMYLATQAGLKCLASRASRRFKLPRDETDAGKAEFEFDAPVARDHTLVCQGRWAGRHADCLAARLDAGPYEVLGGRGRKDEWITVIGPTWHLAAGRHKLTVSVCEPGAAFASLRLVPAAAHIAAEMKFEGGRLVFPSSRLLVAPLTGAASLDDSRFGVFYADAGPVGGAPAARSRPFTLAGPDGQILYEGNLSAGQEATVALSAPPPGRYQITVGAERLNVFNLHELGYRVPGQYKQIVRGAVTLAATGKPADAAAVCEGMLSRHPKDLECLYALAIARAQQGNTKRAMECVEKATRWGLPFERFLAGPRDLMEPLYADRAFRRFAKRHGRQLLHGPVVGGVTDERALFWVRTWTEARFAVRVSASSDMTDALVSRSVSTREQADYTAVAEVNGLRPDTHYYYQVLLDGRPVAMQPLPSFRSSPRPGTACRFRVGFGGGAGYTPWHEKMWTVIGGRHPRAFLLLGDNVYIDTPKVPQTQRYCYYRRQSRPEYRLFAASTPIYAIWDDHDFGTNDCLGSPQVDSPAWKPAVWDVFRQNFVNPSYGGGHAQPGCWSAMSIGDVDFFLLDCRYYRTRPKDHTPTMLGPVQKKWLKDQLRSSTGTFKVIASSVPWAHGTKPGSKDTWDGFPEEREEVFKFIEDNRIDGVVLLAADRHRSDAWKIDRPNGYALYDLMSSRLTNVHTHGIIRGCLFGYNEKCSFGLLTFDTTAADPTVTYEIVNIDNAVIHTLTLSKSQLTHPRRN